MSWVRPDFPQYAEFVDKVRVSIMQSKGVCIRVSIGRNIWKELGWSPGIKVDLEYGTGNDANWLRISRWERGIKLNFSNGQVYEGALILKTNRVIPGMKSTNVEITECKHTITPSGELMVKLSQEFWAGHERKKPYTPKIASRATESESRSPTIPTKDAASVEKPKQNGAFPHSAGD